MKRHVLTIFILVVLNCLLPAEEERVWIAPYNTSTIDMTSDWFQPVTGTAPKDWWTGGTGKPPVGYYNNTTMLALVGVSFSSEKKFVTFNFSSPKAWKYVSASNESLYRPFGVDLIMKGATRNDGGGKVAVHEMIQDVIHLGYSTARTPSELVTTVVLPRTDGEENDINHRKYYGSWVDVILVLPGSVESEGYIDVYNDGGPSERNLEYCKLAPANDFITQFSVIVSDEQGNVDSTHTFIMNGYYIAEPENTPSGNVSLMLTKLGAASNLDIRSLVSNSERIADYGFSMASSYETDKNDRKWTERDYHFFLSSDTSGGSKFALRKIGTENATMNKYNGINYEVAIHSDYDTEDQSTWYWFDGSDSTYSAGVNGISSFPLAKERVEALSTKNMNHRSFTFYDEGGIYIRIPQNQSSSEQENYDVTYLNAGRYRSSIYFNVICNK